MSAWAFKGCLWSYAKSTTLSCAGLFILIHKSLLFWIYTVFKRGDGILYKVMPTVHLGDDAVHLGDDDNFMHFSGFIHDVALVCSCFVFNINLIKLHTKCKVEKSQN